MATDTTRTSEEEEDAPEGSRRQRYSLLGRRSTHQTADIYDHAIGMVDRTITNGSADASGGQTPDLTKSGEEEDPSRRRDRIRASVRGEYNRQKWRRYQQGRVEGSEGPLSEGDDITGESDVKKKPQKDTYGRGTIRRNYDRVRDRLPIGQRSKEEIKKKEEFEIDILYENQRGWFFCGIPLYSHQSLLNFDPPAWQTREFKDSPVNITNAQPPDPTWVWAWRTWYVDMSHDVDEEGWEYSLSFQQGFSWHGTHPWFHSFVRRRRWLRKRIKLKQPGKGKSRDALQEGHKLNMDYFTIHSAPREPSTDRVTTLADAASSSNNNQRYSLITSRSYASDEEDGDSPDEIRDVNSLLKALKAATVDRKKLSSIRSFLSNAGPELHYLPDKIPEIMDIFVYQTSRREVLHELQQAAGTDKYLPSKSSKKAEDEGPLSDSDGANDPKISSSRPKPEYRPSSLILPLSTASGVFSSRSPSRTGSSVSVATPTIDSVADQITALNRAIEIAHDRIRHFEYWSDVKATVNEGEALDVPPPPPGGPDLAPTDDRTKRPPSLPRQKSGGGGQIKGIPKEAKIGEQVGIARRVTLQMREKGKEDRQTVTESPTASKLQEEGSGSGSGSGSPEAGADRTVLDDVEDNMQDGDVEGQPLETLDAVPEAEGDQAAAGSKGDDGGNDHDNDGERPTSTNKGKGKGREKV